MEKEKRAPDVARPKVRTIFNGYKQLRFDGWNSFSYWVQSELSDFESYIYRGQCIEKWILDTSFDRLLEDMGSQPDKRPHLLAKHQDNFRKAIRGRLAPGTPLPLPALWTLGRHYGLATPLLDWSESPFVAAYFAFYEVVENEPDEAYRVVWCLYKKRVSDAGHVTIIDPDTTFNVRLLSQRGLLTDAGEAACIEDVIQRTYADRPKGRGLMKCLIPVKDRELALKSLNLMNINHITLFPDVEGSSQYANLKLQIPSY